MPHDLIPDAGAPAEEHDVESPTISFSHLALSVSNLNRSVEFYRDGLGFAAAEVYQGAGRRVAALMGIPPSGFRGVFLRLGRVYVELLEYRDPLPPRAARPDARTIGYAHISLIVADAEAALRKACRPGGCHVSQLDHRFGQHTQSTLAFLTDPDHNRIELIEHPEIEEERAHARYLGLGGLGWPTTTHGSDPTT